MPAEADAKPTIDAKATADAMPAADAKKPTAEAQPSTEPEQSLTVRPATVASSSDVAQHVPDARQRRLVRAALGVLVTAALTAGIVSVVRQPSTNSAEAYWNIGTTVSRTPTGDDPSTAEGSESPSPSPSPSPTPSATTLTSVAPRTAPPPPPDHVVGTQAPLPPSPTATEPNCPQPFPPNGDPQPGTLEWYLAQVPCFPPAPAPVPVTLSHDEGRAAWVARVPTSQPVAFITVDDGYWTEELTRALIQTTGIPVASFLTWDAVADDIPYFQSIMHSGMVADNHTTTHPDLVDLTYEEQVAEICTAQDLLANAFGRRPTNMRTPQLLYNDDTLRAAWDCGISVVVDGMVSSSGGSLYYRSETLTLKPGDIIILHYDPEFADHFILALHAIHAAGLVPALLTDYLMPLQ